jgi:hypothetical protein
MDRTAPPAAGAEGPETIRALRAAFEERCFTGALPDAKHDAPSGVLQPVGCTMHTREAYGPLRVWHLLVRLRDA